MTRDDKKVIAIIGLILLSTVVGFYNRTQPQKTPTVSVIPKPAVMVIPIEGMITATSTQWDGSMIDAVISQLDQAKESKNVKAVVLRINSPGGTVGASQEIYDAILRFKQDADKKVVVSIMDVGASGAYWIAMAGDYIFSKPGSIVGSLGVVTQTFDLTDVPKKYGLDVRTYKAGVHKDLLNPWRNPTKDDEYLINKMLRTVHQQFKATLMDRRGVSKEKAAILADGRVYAGEDALNEQLVDELGGLHDAVQYAGELAGVTDPRVVYPNRGIKDWVGSLRVLGHAQHWLSMAQTGVPWMH